MAEPTVEIVYAGKGGSFTDRNRVTHLPGQPWTAPVDEAQGYMAGNRWVKTVEQYEADQVAEAEKAIADAAAQEAIGTTLTDEQAATVPAPTPPKASTGSALSVSDLKAGGRTTPTRRRRSTS